MSQIRRFFTEGFGTLLHQRSWGSSERALEVYYENLTPSSLSADLVDALGRLNDDIKNEHPRRIFQEHAVASHDGLLRWDEVCLKNWIMANDYPPVLSSFVPTLWQVFVYFARYPGIDGRAAAADADADDIQSVGPSIDEKSFIIAYNLLPLRGVELLGKIEKSWTTKYPRLASLMFSSLGASCSEDAPKYSEKVSNPDRREILEGQIVDAIIITRPEPYIEVVSHDEDVKKVARKLLLPKMPIHESRPPIFIPRLALRTLLQLYLLLRLDNAPWKRGLIHYMKVKRCGDIEKPFFIDGGVEVADSSCLAEALIQNKIGDAPFISWESFKEFCSSYPNIVLRFYELWTTICLDARPLSPSPNFDFQLPNSIAQSLSLIGPVILDSLVPGGSPFNEDERQLQLDMQSATLVAETGSTSDLNVEKLVELLNTAENFHILLVSAAEENHDTGSEGTGSPQSSEHLFTLFSSTPGREIMFEGTPGCTNYTWRCGLVQLLPRISTSLTGGLAAVLIDDARFRVSPPNQSGPVSDQNFVSVIFDVKSGTVVVEETGNFLHLRLNSLRCFRMPGTAATFTNSS